MSNVAETAKNQMAEKSSSYRRLWNLQLQLKVRPKRQPKICKFQQQKNDSNKGAVIFIPKTHIYRDMDADEIVKKTDIEVPKQ